MRIVLANHTPVFGSGSGTYIAMLAHGLNQAGHDVCILTPDAEQFSSDGPGEHFSLNWEKLKFPSFTGHPLSSIRYDHLDDQKLSALVIAWREALTELKKTWSPDIVHVQHLWVIARAALSAGLKPIVTCHGSELEYAVKHSKLAKLLLPSPKGLGTVINISSFVNQKLDSFAIYTHSTIILPNPYNDDLFYFESDANENRGSLHLGYVGRLVPYKRCDHFLEGIAQLKGIVPSLSASVVGDGPHRHNLESFAEKLNIMEHVRFYGHLAQEQLRRYYQLFDVLIVPSRREPFGLTAIESVACGTPAVVAKSGGLAELVHPPFILGYEENSLMDMIVKVTGAVSKDDHANFGFAANAFVKKQYALKAYIRRLEKIYRNLDK